jgi:transcriptional antiterminator NusG
MKNWVILFVRTGSEKQILRKLKENLNANEYLPFLPTKEAPHRTRGVIYKVRKLLFPGYVFIQTEIEGSTIIEMLELIITGTTWSKDIYTILHYGDNKKDVVVRKAERLYWERLFDSKFCITESVGLIEGNVVRIISGVLIGMESNIKRINRHKREAIVEMEMMGGMREVRLMLDVVEKSNRTTK